MPAGSAPWMHPRPIARSSAGRERGRIDGSAAKDKLRLGVEAALRELGAGFLENPANGDLRDALRTGKLTRQAYYEELLRLVYRLILPVRRRGPRPPAHPERAEYR